MELRRKVHSDVEFRNEAKSKFISVYRFRLKLARSKGTRSRVIQTPSYPMRAKSYRDDFLRYQSLCPSLRIQSPVQFKRRAYQPQMGKGLREIAQVFAGWTQFFREQAEVIGIP